MINNDFRFLNNGLLIPTPKGGYADQPSLVALSDGTLVCCVTTGAPIEGARGTYLSLLRSKDGGKTWCEPYTIEDVAWESSYGVLITDKNERLYCFYDHNLDHYVDIECGWHRVDMGGHFCMRYSDDGGITWSERRVIDIRFTDIDKNYPFIFVNGKQYRWFWNMARPFFNGDDFYLSMARPYMPGFLMGVDMSPNYVVERPVKKTGTIRGILLRSRGLASDPDAPFETLPEGELELLPLPGDRVTEEQCCVRLSDGTLYVISRTTSGYPACFISRDDGNTFTPAFIPQHIGGMPVKHPRAANLIWKTEEGKYIYWFHNAGSGEYENRNPAWICPCYEADTPEGKTLEFGQPEILFYHPSPKMTFSYPDLVMVDGHYAISETQKQIARLHIMPDEFMNKVFDQDKHNYRLNGISKEALVASGLPKQVYVKQNKNDLEDWGEVVPSAGTTLVFEGAFSEGESILSAVDRDGNGLSVDLDTEGRIICYMGSTIANFTLKSSIKIADGKKHHFVWINDGAAKVSYLVIDGIFDNGGKEKICGWCHIPSQIPKIDAVKAVSVSENTQRLELIDRFVYTADAIADYRASGI